MTTPKPRGGKRPGAGRPKGRKNTVPANPMPILSSRVSSSHYARLRAGLDAQGLRVWIQRQIDLCFPEQ